MQLRLSSVNWEFPVIEAAGFGGLFASKCPENAVKWTAKPTIFAIRYLVRYLFGHLVSYMMFS